MVWACVAKRWLYIVKCMEYEVEGPRPIGRPKRTWREVVERDCQAHKLNKEDAVDRSRWRKLIKDVWWPGWVWVGECFFWYRPTWVLPDNGPLNGCTCVCVFHASWSFAVNLRVWFVVHRLWMLTVTWRQWPTFTISIPACSSTAPLSTSVWVCDWKISTEYCRWCVSGLGCQEMGRANPQKTSFLDQDCRVGF